MGLAGALTSWACLGIGLALGWWIRDRAAHHGPHQPPDPAATGPPAPPTPSDSSNSSEPGRHGLLTAEMQALPPPLDPSAAYRTRPPPPPLPRPLPPEHPQTHAADHFGTRASDPPTALQPLPPPLPGGRRRSDQPRQTRRQARAVREGPPDEPPTTELTDNPP